MLSWSRPSPLRSRPNTPSPGDWPVSSASVCATCSSSEAPSWEAGLPKMQQRHRLVGRHGRRRGDLDLGLAGRPGDGDADRGRLRRVGREEVEPRIDRVEIVEGDDAVGEGEPPAAQAERAAAHGEAADDRGRGRAAADGELAAHLGIEAAAAHEDRLRGAHVERQLDRRRRRGRRRLPGRLLRRRRLGGRDGGAGLVDLADVEGGERGRLAAADRDLGAVDRDGSRNLDARARSRR